MKKKALVNLFIILTVIISMYTFLGDANSQKIKVESLVEADSLIIDSKIVVYYFHTTARCLSCHKIEQYTKEALEKFFFDDMTVGKIELQIINTEEPQNKHFIQDYQLYTKSVVLSKVVNGKEVKFKNLEMVWKSLKNKNKFYEYIKNETNSFIN